MGYPSSSLYRIKTALQFSFNRLYFHYQTYATHSTCYQLLIPSVKMKFFRLAGTLSLAAVTIAVPVVDVVERQNAVACAAKGGKQFCCSSPVGQTPAGLLSIIPAFSCA
jgi:hypothetical protein